jgi:glycosyltransferase involved in cell wall biosynthesis
MSKKIKLLHYTSTFLPVLGGAQFFIKYLAEEINRQDRLSQVFVSSTINAHKYLESVNDVQSFNMNETDTKKRLFVIIYKLKNEINLHKPDVILCHSAYIDLFIVTLASLWAFKFPKIVVVSHGNDLGKDERSGYGITRSRWKAMLVKLLVKRTHKLICPSNFQRAHATNYVSDQSKMCVVPNGIPMTGNNHKKETLRQDSFNLILMSSARPVKQLAFALSSLVALAKKYEELNIFVTCEDEHICQQATVEYSNEGVQDQLHLIGHIYGERKQNILNEMHVLLLPSLYENCPITILECFNYDIIPVASRTGGIPELITQLQNGLLFEPADANDINASVEMLLKSRDLNNEIRRNIRSTRDRYDIQNVTKKYINIMEEVCQ